MSLQSILKDFGLNEKEGGVYLALINLGPSPVRVIAEKAEVNRGTTYDILRSLIAIGIVSYYNKETKQYFIAESPEKLLTAIKAKQEQLDLVKDQINASLPELRTLFEKQGGKPAVKLYEGLKGIRAILDDVLSSVANAKDKQYYVYSSATVRKNVRQAMPDFSKRRVSKKIKVQTIALGGGGHLNGLDERKWLDVPEKDLKSTYEIIYAGKVAHISLDNAENPVGVVIHNQEIFETQRVIFLFNWDKL